MMFRGPLQLFGFAPNGVTVLCPGVAVGDSFTLGGVTYTKRDRAGLMALVDAPPTRPIWSRPARRA
jgi:hypothetical protein